MRSRSFCGMWVLRWVVSEYNLGLSPALCLTHPRITAEVVKHDQYPYSRLTPIPDPTDLSSEKREVERNRRAPEVSLLTPIRSPWQNASTELGD